MGVDYFVCASCGDTFPDCGDYTPCNEDFGGCGRMYCDDKCAGIRNGRRGTSREYEAFRALSEEEKEASRTSCKDCRGEHATAANVLAFILKSIGMTRDEADAKYLAEAGKA